MLAESVKQTRFSTEWIYAEDRTGGKVPQSERFSRVKFW